MKPFQKFLFACIPLGVLAACGGGDTEDRLDVADPQVRFIHVSAIAPNVTLYRGAVAQPDATNVAYPSASNYFDTDSSVADWSVKTTVGGVNVGTETIDPDRGTKYTILALPASSTETTIYRISDPYNKSLGSDNTHLRVMNASFNAANIDLYMQAVGTDINGVTPRIAATAFKTAGPATGADSVEIEGGTYELTITTAGTKTVLFKSQLTFEKNKDLLLVTVPNAAAPTGIKTLLKTEGTAGLTELPAM